MNKWTDIINCINDSKDIVILTHTNMDGDAMGSTAALCCALRRLGKRAAVLIEDTIPGYLSVIDHKTNYPYFVSEMPFEADLAIAVDCGDEKRIENRIDAFKNAKTRLCIDHHIQMEDFADYCVVEPQAAATGMLIFELLSELNFQIDKEIAEYLYVAIVTDTGRFKYDNTTAEVHKTVAKLYEYGIDGSAICTALYDSYPIEQLKAEAHAQELMELFADNKAVISNIRISDMQRIGAAFDQIDTCIDRIRVTGGVEIAAFLKEKEPNVFKLSLRSKSYADVNKVAQALGGGGHIRAAGATLEMDIDKAYALIKEEVEKELKRYN